MNNRVLANRRRLANMVGKRFGRIIVDSVAEYGSNGKKTKWLCRCDCGNTSITTGDLLRSGSTTSCGCVHREQLVLRNTKHGQAKSVENVAWSNIKTRCTNPNTGRSWQDYGGRGIKICKRWSESFVDFLADIGKRPSKRHSVDRIDVNGHYSCGKCDECVANGWTANCRWATTDEQSRNTRSNRMLTANGKTMCIKDWADETGIPRHVIFGRLDVCGWDDQRTVTEPVHKQSPLRSASEGFSSKPDMYATAEYRALHAAKGRCFNKKNHRFPAYGGRGITVCERWCQKIDGFFNFIADVGYRPSGKHSLDRIDVNGNYSCGKCAQCAANGWQANCRWATVQEQANNKRQHVS